MLVFIFIHSNGQFVKKMAVEVDEWSELDNYYQEALKKYASKDFGFGVMCC